MSSIFTVQRVLAPALLLLSVFVLPAAAQRFDHDEVIEETFKVGPGRMLSIDADLGSIEVRGGGRDVQVTVIKGVNDVSRREAEALFDRYRVEMRETREGVEIIGRRRDRASWWRRNQLQVRYRITVPERFNVDLRTAGGSIEIADLDGKARIKTSGGSLRVDNVAGPVEAETSGGSITARRLGDDARLHTSGGAITVEDAGGRIDANTSGGSIRVAGARGDVRARTSGGSIMLTGIAGAVDAHTSGGSVEAEIVGQVQRPVTLDTSGGSVTLRLDRNVRADLEARSSGGRVRLDFDADVRGEVKRDRISGALNGGGPLITLHSSGGGVSIRAR